MDNQISIAVERLEAMLLSLREQLAELREKVDENEAHRRSGAALLEQSEHWLDRDGRKL